MFKAICNWFRAKKQVRELEILNASLHDAIDERDIELRCLKRTLATLANMSADDLPRSPEDVSQSPLKAYKNVASVIDLVEANTNLAWENNWLESELHNTREDLKTAKSTIDLLNERYESTRKKFQRKEANWEAEYSKLAAKNITLQAKIAELEGLVDI